jgi:hypothetical protein
MNSVANGKLFERTAFRDLYVPAAAGDAGGAIGAACTVWNDTLGQPRHHVMTHAFLGPRFTNEQVEAELEAHAAELQDAACSSRRIDDEAELCRIEGEGPVRQQVDDLAHAGQLGRLAVGRQPHDLVLVAIAPEPQELGEGLVEEPHRVWKVDGAADLDPLPPAKGPHGADKIPEAVDRNHRSLLEGRDEEGADEMGAMMLHGVEAGADRLGRDLQRGGETIRDALDA